MERNIFFLIAFFFTVSSFAADIATEITQLLKEQSEAWNRGDLEAFVSPYDDSGKLVFVSTVVIRSPEELRERYEKRYKSEETSDFGTLSFSDLQVQELAPGLARTWGRWNVVQKGKTSSGWFTLILQKSGDHWRIIHDHSS